MLSGRRTFLSVTQASLVAMPDTTVLHVLMPTPVPCPPSPQDEYKDEPGSVIAADFYGASRLLPLSGAGAELRQNAGWKGYVMHADKATIINTRGVCACRADEEIVRKVQSNMATCEPAFGEAQVGPSASWRCMGH